jgi:hypothetical protein
METTMAFPARSNGASNQSHKTHAHRPTSSNLALNPVRFAHWTVSSTTRASPSLAIPADKFFVFSAVLLQPV